MSAYAVMTKPCAEFRAAADLVERGFTPYVPTVTRWTNQAGRRKREARAILSRYLFVWSDDIERDFAGIRHASYVAGIIMCGARPAIMPQDWLASLMTMQCFGLFDYTLTRKPRLTISQNVKVIAGQFKGYVGKVVEMGENRTKIVLPKGGSMVLDVCQLAAA